MAALVDTNVLVYRFDPRDPRKQQVATDVLRTGIDDGSLKLSHGAPLLGAPDAHREAEELLSQLGESRSPVHERSGSDGL